MDIESVPRPNWSLSVAFERVYCISNYYDGPKEGIANYEGRPHRYLFEWDELADDYAKTFTLAPVDEETMKLALEQWNIWRKWEIAFRRGAVDQKSHPGFGGIDARYDQLKSMLQSRYKQLNRLPQSFYANFQNDFDAGDPDVGWSTSTKVEWTIADMPHAGTSDRR
jgi:hypothetical protein